MKKNNMYDALSDTKRIDFRKIMRRQLARNHRIKTLKSLPKSFVQNKIAYWLFPFLALAIPWSAMLSRQYPFSENSFVWVFYWLSFLLSGFVLALKVNWAEEKTITAMLIAFVVYFFGGVPTFIVQTTFYS